CDHAYVISRYYCVLSLYLDIFSLHLFILHIKFCFFLIAFALCCCFFFFFFCFFFFFFFFFFFQAEDGIRDLYVTGVQTCALPISISPHPCAPFSASPA